MMFYRCFILTIILLKGVYLFYSLKAMAYPENGFQNEIASKRYLFFYLFNLF